MYTPTQIILLIILSLIVLSFYLSIQQINKFKTAAYNISTQTTEKITKYYLVVEMKHGQYIDTRKLSNLTHLFISKHITPLLKATYDNYESAEKSLQEIKLKN